MLSSANDRYIIAWAPGGGVHDRISVSAVWFISFKPQVSFLWETGMFPGLSCFNCVVY